MKKITMLAIAAMSILYACSPKMNSSTNKSGTFLLTDTYGKPMLTGECRKSSLEQAPFNEWFNKNYSAYQLNDSVLEAIKPLIEGKTFLLFMGTWCGDSRREIPRMFRVLDSSNVPQTKIRIVLLDDHDSVYKQSPGHEEKGLNIHRVPTLIVFDNNKELGRIVESPVVSIEKDLLSILKAEGYRPQYKAVIYLDSLYNTGTATISESGIPAIASAVKPIVKNAGELNTYGYVLMSANEKDKAKLAFELNTLLYPEVANVFDSMGEFYFKNGEKSLAKKNYEKVLSLEPGNENAKKMLEKL